jgi:hypothetical protein
MRGCAWLTGIDRHALHASVCEQAGVACEAVFKVEPSRSRRLYLFSSLRYYKLKVYNSACPARVWRERPMPDLSGCLAGYISAAQA